MPDQTSSKDFSRVPASANIRLQWQAITRSMLKTCRRHSIHRLHNLLPSRAHTERPTRATESKMLWLAVAYMLLFCGCGSSNGGFAFRSNKGEQIRSYFVIGFGYVRVACPTNNPSVVGASVRGAGIHVSDIPGLRVGVGLYDTTTIMVGSGSSNTVVEFYRKPFHSPQMHIHTSDP